ncbi:MAG: [FeFe] hydrogenase H-cluster radical SAM maturase HydE [Synergistaceae bacterium]
MSNIDRINELYENNCINKEELTLLIKTCSPHDREYAAMKARSLTDAVFEKKVYLRALIEITNYCKNNCYYCGIRAENSDISRYRLSEEDIFFACSEAYELGLRTFVLQGGEDAYYTDEMLCNIVKKIKKNFANCALTFSLGEKSFASYKMFFEAGVDRYLLRHETASRTHYLQLHPQNMDFDNRMRCLNDLKLIGFQTGCGFMVGSPYQTIENIVDDLLFIKDFNPQMVGIGPFIPHKDTPFRAFTPGTAEKTLLLLSIVRMLLPRVLLPATTALGTVSNNGRESGILSGANVIMPNVSPSYARHNYKLYDNKIGSEDDVTESVENVSRFVRDLGYKVVIDRGDYS